MIGRAKGHGEESISDEALISGIAVGDEEASLAFVRRYQRRLFGLAIGIVRDPPIDDSVFLEGGRGDFLSHISRHYQNAEGR